MSRYYVLDGERVPRPVSSREWGEWLEKNDGAVALDKVGSLRVSTVFLGLDHDYTGQGPPLLFETMVFDDGGAVDKYTRRWCTYREAEVGHAAVLAEVRAGELS